MTKKTVNNSFYKSSSGHPPQGHSISPDKNFQFDSHKLKNKHRGSRDETVLVTHLPDLTGNGKSSFCA